MYHWTTMVVASSLASLTGMASAQIDCGALPPGPKRTDCFIGLSRIHQGQSNIAAGKARVQTDAARYRGTTGSSPSASRKALARPPFPDQ
jgi:hypothetical protein